jgi:osmotically-inducible protein OsmY
MKSKISAVLMIAMLFFGGCTAMTGQTAGQYVDDSTITASVKGKLAQDKLGTLTRVDVDTTNRVVTLTGIVQTPDDRARAQRLAQEVGGVKEVKNNLQIQKTNP